MIYLPSWTWGAGRGVWIYKILKTRTFSQHFTAMKCASCSPFGTLLQSEMMFLPFHIRQLMKCLPFHIPETWKYPFRAEPPRIFHYTESSNAGMNRPQFRERAIYCNEFSTTQCTFDEADQHLPGLYSPVCLYISNISEVLPFFDRKLSKLLDSHLICGQV